ncbi:hypothetical protein CVD25_06695 [Bacillus canaveralius]|uniref:Uncharacterized protein n=1 Tax=Bacillus canaveralius TaxID=1403243 RepID=A0A2N5GJ33_9BACI|nr:hypothetical protein [Bacillus canaveralius]PLR81064.1 hypothetical protein CU635_16260 [Bacillus canaveralius]PLR98962.1 hypothetical protein CVD25_06695 [Bacillus canaveralius]
MRFLIRKSPTENIQVELQAVQTVMVSSYFVMADLFFYALLFTLMLTPMLPSIFTAVLFFISVYGSFGALYIFLKKSLVCPDKDTCL